MSQNFKMEHEILYVEKLYFAKITEIYKTKYIFWLPAFATLGLILG